jgi:hypothetical protein
MPPDIPVKDFWALTMYDTQTRCQLQTDQRFPTLDSYREGMKKNADGSIDVYFSPKAPKGQPGDFKPAPEKDADPLREPGVSPAAIPPKAPRARSSTSSTCSAPPSSTSTCTRRCRRTA